MNNFLKIILIFIFITNCSLHKNSKFWSETEKIKVIKTEKEEQKEKKVVNRNKENCHRIFLIKVCKKEKFRCSQKNEDCGTAEEHCFSFLHWAHCDTL